MTNITEQIYSNEYGDYILPYSDYDVTIRYKNYGVQLLDTRYMLIHDSRITPTFPIQNTTGLYTEYPYIPKLFTTLNTTSLEESGIIKVHTQPYLQLSGENTLVGFIDTGIDYTHPVFLDQNGETRILSIWDQTIAPDDSNNSPFQYGTIYRSYEINQALKSLNPYQVVPSIDEIGHGTALAGIACGSPDQANDFIGTAYNAKISVVKLKRAKQYLYEYYFADPTKDVYQENDIMTAIRFLISQSEQYNLPLTICIGLGTNQGDHNGNSPLSQMISFLSYASYTTFAVAGGNEGDKAHHAYHKLNDSYQDLEILVPEHTQGFTAELWGSTNALLSIGIISPLGTQISPIATRPGQNDLISFVLEPATIEISYSIVTESGGNQLIALRFITPTPGNWIIRVYKRSTTAASFHMWLPITNLLPQDITFFNPDPYTTITIPSDSSESISTASYNAYDGSLSIDSSRGYTTKNNIKPNLTTPGIRVTGPNLRHSYSAFSGSSVSCAILAGSISLLQEWRMKMSIPGILNSSIITGYLTRGAIRDDDQIYPNRLWGYGKLNVFNIFQSIME